jgi:putative transposase
MPDHVHLFIQGKPKLAPNNIIAGIKGYTSNMLRKEFPKLLKIPTLWTRSYFVSTAGNISMSVIQKYIQSQRGK